MNKKQKEAVKEMVRLHGIPDRVTLTFNRIPDDILRYYIDHKG